jgi:hypothetical protein
MKLTNLLPSFLTEVILTEVILTEVNTELLLDKEVRAFIALKDTRTKEENIKILTDLINDHLQAMRDTEDKFTQIVNSAIPKKGSSGGISFIHQLKSVGSIIDKVLNRNKAIDKITDLIRGVVLFKDKDEMADFIKDFKRKYASYITDYEFKEKGSDTTYGYYGSHHFDLAINGFDVELQVMPNKLWSYKEVAHGIYNKWRSSPTPVEKFDQSLSKRLFVKGNMDESVIVDGIKYKAFGFWFDY